MDFQHRISERLRESRHSTDNPGFAQGGTDAGTDAGADAGTSAGHQQPRHEHPGGTRHRDPAPYRFILAPLAALFLVFVFPWMLSHNFFSSPTSSSTSTSTSTSISITTTYEPPPPVLTAKTQPLEDSVDPSSEANMSNEQTYVLTCPPPRAPSPDFDLSDNSGSICKRQLS